MHNLYELSNDAVFVELLYNKGAFQVMIGFLVWTWLYANNANAPAPPPLKVSKGVVVYLQG